MRWPRLLTGREPGVDLPARRQEVPGSRIFEETWQSNSVRYSLESRRRRKRSSSGSCCERVRISIGRVVERPRICRRTLKQFTLTSLIGGEVANSGRTCRWAIG